ncbi:PAS domain-containing protein [Olleya sp. HaHaR_3_96]|uniref:PAS domain-containing sensor histidine kinase n=1 Tax=Olleya sp. HaHaR_3_96 TaxID=2745560 RepID=UPI001C4E3B8F|nr:PAS domain-containing protein [Olleya sp. HaHaR_3_96]QXP59129.1 PAS domain-containing protein [Olleya sp. HaHaR_3_96]
MSELYNGIQLNPTISNENEKYQLALGISKVGIWDYCAASNKIFFSKPSKSIIGLEDDATFGNNANDWNNRVHPEDREKYFKDFQDHLKGKKPIYKNKHRVLHKDGSYRWILDRGQIIEKDKNGQASRIIGSHVDITEYSENERKVQETLNLVVKQNSKLQNFAHIVTHNLKQHAGNFESLLSLYEQADSKAEKKQMFDYLKTLSNSLSSTITNLNEIVTVQSKQKAQTNKLYISKETELVLKELDYFIKDNNATVINKTEIDCYLFFNTSYFQSILQNLILNAIKYKHPNRNPEVTIISTCSKNAIEIKVSDNGLGIDLDKFGEDIFGLYKTFHTNHDSEGVGLYLVKNQIEAFGGTIKVDSEVNKGTTFTINIPNSIN